VFLLFQDVAAQMCRSYLLSRFAKAQHNLGAFERNGRACFPFFRTGMKYGLTWLATLIT
jgi:hypothetical protein